MEISKNLVSERFNSLLAALNLNVPDMARYLGYERSDKLYNISKGKYLPSFEIMYDITKKFVRVNANWLLTGEGSMFRDNNNPESASLTCTPETASISPAEEAIIYKMYKEKEAKIEELNVKMLSMSEEIGRLKAQVEQQHPELSESHSKDLSNAKDASIKKHSSQLNPNVGSVIAPSKD